MYDLRYYQEDAVAATFDYINKGGRAGIAALPTGAGKSLIIASICKRILTKKDHVRIMMLTHVKELIEQNYKKLKETWPHAPAGIYSAGIKRRQFLNSIIFGGIQSVYKNPHLFGKVNLLIIDECHLLSEKDESMYGSFIAELKKVNPDLVIVGLTATPYRLNMGMLTNGPIFDDIYYDITTMDDFVRLIDEGYLCDLIPIHTDMEFDLSAVQKRAGEFTDKSLDENVNRAEITKRVVAETIERTKDRNKGMAFCVSKTHAESMADMFNQAGYPATFIHSDLDKSEREQRIKDYHDGKYRVLTNVGVLTTGFDSPDTDFLVIARPTESTGLHVQIMGRGMRVYPNKPNCLVLDFAGNTLRLGPVNDPVIPRPKGEAKGDAPIRICEKCDTINHASARVCKNCGHEFPPPKVRIAETSYSEELIRRSEKPKIYNRPVDKVFVNKHTSTKGNNVVKLTYMCGREMFDMYIPVEADNHSTLTLAAQKWALTGMHEKMPRNVDIAVDLLRTKMQKPEEIRVWHNKPVYGTNRKIREVMDVVFKV